MYTCGIEETIVGDTAGASIGSAQTGSTRWYTSCALAIVRYGGQSTAGNTIGQIEVECSQTGHASRCSACTGGTMASATDTFRYVGDSARRTVSNARCTIVKVIIGHAGKTNCLRETINAGTDAGLAERVSVVE